MIESAEFPVHLNQIMKLINNFPRDAPSFLLEACCRHLKDVLDYFNCLHNTLHDSAVDLNSIYKFFSRIPDAVATIIELNGKSCDRSFEAIDSTISFINNILVFCDKKSDVVSLAVLMRDVLENRMPDLSSFDHLNAIVKFYSKILLENFARKTNRSDSARFTLFMMTAFQIVTDGMHMVLRPDCEVTVIDEAFDLCFNVLDHFKNDEDICEKTSEVLNFLILTTENAGRFNYEDLFERLVKYYQKLRNSCLLEPFIYLVDNFKYHINSPMWFFPHFKIIVEHTGVFLSNKEINDHLLFVKRLMQLINPILAERYENLLEKIDIGNIVELASRGLLLEDTITFNECHKLLTELFIHPTLSDYSCGKCKSRPETKSIVGNLHNSHVHEIVKNCINVILSSGGSSHVKECGNLLRAMKITERNDIEKSFLIERGFMSEIWEISLMKSVKRKASLTT
ncbi:hypothetical protein RF11_14652 [Thelohanellus kitauei]|uniref:Uncharacterized protein n=1 Tax=Thelohanellus kitauei TaxID=669202 RepID=A0A0C2MQU2_THEKT|nr:hypothetical protein RF11_14652 [Thelohanellus kitauei]